MADKGNIKSLLIDCIIINTSIKNKYLSKLGKLVCSYNSEFQWPYQHKFNERLDTSLSQYMNKKFCFVFHLYPDLMFCFIQLDYEQNKTKQKLLHEKEMAFVNKHRHPWVSVSWVTLSY